MADDEKKENGVDTAFDDNIFQAVTRSNRGGANLILSPFSILCAMTICMLGAKDNTLKQMMNVLYPNKKDDKLSFENSSKLTAEMITLCRYYNETFDGKNEKPMIKIANKLFIAKGYKILDAYIKASSVDSVGEFDCNEPEKTAEMVNKWVSDNTNEMIKDIVKKGDFTASTKLVIGNAIYFKALFQVKFPKENTQKNIPFYADKARKNEISKVSMMSMEKWINYKTKYKGIYDMVQLKYKNSDLSLILCINNHSNKKEAPLTKAEIIKELLENKEAFMMGGGKLELYVPSFKYEYNVELKQTLQAMGMEDAFEGKADFSFMNGQKDLRISKVIHKAIIEVNEAGTEAAAATVVMMMNGITAVQKDEPTIIRFDHPFSFYIIDGKKKSTLFSGTYRGK